MNHIGERIFNGISWMIAGAGVVTNFESIKSTLLFVAGFVLLIVQIYLHIIKIRNEKKNGKSKQ